MTGVRPLASLQKAMVGLGNASTLHSRITESPAAAIVIPEAWIAGISKDERENRLSIVYVLLLTKLYLLTT